MIKNELHVKAPGNWINDPNGFIYYQGKYHLFYQHFPFAPVWGTMHWGHAVSDDLVHWEHQDVALFPTKSYDRNGVFSGSAIEKDGRLYLYYSAVRYLQENAENIHLAGNDSFETSQALLISEDGYQFDNWKDKKQIIPVCHDEKIADATHTRDPKVWRDGEFYYMILGSTYRLEKGRVLFYRSRDAVNWEYVNQCRNAIYGHTLECPDLFKVGEDTVFIGSPMGILNDGLEYANHSVCTVVDFEPETCCMELSDEYQFVDYGLDLYAPQTNVDKDGRRVMIAWMRMPKAVENAGETPWNGMMCLPRVVEVEKGHIYFRVHPEVDAYFAGKGKCLEIHCGEEGWQDEIDFTRPCRIKTTITEGEHLEIGGYQICLEGGCVKTDRSRVFAALKGYRTKSCTPAVGARCELDIFVEPNLVEIFVNGGEYVLSNVVYGLGI